MKLDDIPDDILDDVRSRGLSDEDIVNATPKEIFNEYCNWNGLIHWGNRLWNVVMTLNRKGAKP